LGAKGRNKRLAASTAFELLCVILEALVEYMARYSRLPNNEATFHSLFLLIALKMGYHEALDNLLQGVQDFDLNKSPQCSRDLLSRAEIMTSSHRGSSEGISCDNLVSREETVTRQIHRPNDKQCILDVEEQSLLLWLVRQKISSSLGLVRVKVRTSPTRL
jgi:hypothetical protein